MSDPDLRLTALLLLILLSPAAMARAEPLPQATVYTTGDWLPFSCRTLDSIDDYVVDPANMELSKYGGWKARQVTATGFFRVEKIDGRWWAVDPEGYLYIHKAPNSIHLDDFTADEIYRLLPQYGFNGAGNWTDEELFLSSLKDDMPLAYCPKFSFIAGYRRTRDPRIEMPVFDDAFEGYCNQQAQVFAPYVDDPHVFGYFSDNELPWRDEGLPAHLDIADPGDQNYITAVDFLAARGKTPGDWNTEDQHAYMALMAERYYSVVSAAIRNVDTNHMYIGTRCHSTEKTIEAFLVNAGRYVDIFSINHYNRWGARRVATREMSTWSGRPLLVSEFYAMEDLPGITEDGAGWLVTNQASRGLFYQHFVTSMAEDADVVGWHWFKFQSDEKGNKGMVDPSGNLYTNLFQDMGQLNRQIYNFIDYADTRPPPDVRLPPEADAYFKGTENHGADPELLVKNASAGVYRESYLRFDLSTLDTNIASARIHLYSVATGSESGTYQAELVEDNSWDEMTITLTNNPPGSTVLATWSHGDDLELDVTDVLLDALELDGKLSIRIIATVNNGKTPKYGSREHADEYARPELCIYTEPDCYEAWSGDEGLTNGVNDAYVDDPEFDGRQNLMEYALGSDPLVEDADLYRPGYALVQDAGTNYLEVVYRRRRDREACGLGYAVEVSPALPVPSWGTDGVVEAGTAAIDTEFESVTNRVNADIQMEQFLRLNVTTE